MMCETAPESVLAPARDEKARTSLVDPLRHPDWDSLLEAHPQSTVFQGAGWARVLRDTYGHQPCYVAQFEGRRLAGLLPVMEVTSGWTGRRGVSLPFTDACGSLHGEGADAAALYRAAMACGEERGWKSLECRDLDAAWEGASASLAFYSHVVELGGGMDRVLKGFDSSMRRGLRKAQESGLRVAFETGMPAMRMFYRLHCGTRRRHGVPPQPFRFFENIQKNLMETGQGFIATVEWQGRPVAAGVFFWQGKRGYYKFGASNYGFQQLRPNNLMMWAAMEHCAERGLRTLNLGRTSVFNEGLRRFKLGLGSVEEKVEYGKYEFASKQFVRDADRVEGWFNRVFGVLPLPLLRLAGAVLYPHLS
jgi:CelD/BcsL family acetyltransferase involved in cellulose biosynthesis